MVRAVLARLPATVWALLACVVGLAGCQTVEEGGPRPATSQQRLAAQLDLGRGYLQEGNLAKARIPLQRAVELDSGAWEAHDLLASVYQLEGESELAEKHFRRAIRAGGGARSRNNYGAFLSAVGRVEEACDQFSEAVRDPDYPNRAQTFENLGLCERTRGRDDAAQAALLRAVALGGSRPAAMLELADIHFRAGRNQEARSAYDQFRVGGRQTARSLLLGARIGKAVADADAEASFALMLRNLFPDSDEYRQYRETTSE